MNQNSNVKLGYRLTWGLLRFPEIAEQLPMIVTALDSNEYVNISNIRNTELRDYLHDLMKRLPVELNEFRGWSRSDPDVLVSKYVTSALRQCGAVKAPIELSASESAALRWGAPRIIHLLQVFPDLRSELSSFLQNLLDGNTVQLDDMENENLRDDLSGLLKALGLEEDEDGAIGIPDSPKQTHVTQCLSHLINALQSAERFRPLAAAYGLSENIKSNINESNTSAETCEVVSSIVKTESVNRQVGPMIPSAAQLVEAQKLTKQYVVRGSIKEVDEDEDDFGPSLPTSSGDKDFLARQLVASSSSANVPIGFVGHADNPTSKPAKTKSTETPTDTGGREEWMMTPGENKTIADLYGATGTMGNRKFQTGKGAKQLAEAFSARSADASVLKRRFGDVDVDGADDSDAPQAAVESNESSRGPSLMEAHLEGLKAKKQTAPVGRQAFDRERDVLSRNKMDKNQAAQLVEHAKQLSSRFGSGNTQTRFF